MPVGFPAWIFLPVDQHRRIAQSGTSRKFLDPRSLCAYPSPSLCCRAVYLWHILLSPAAPGAAAWQQSAEALQSVFNESINFFYVNIGLTSLGLSPLPSVASHPVSEVSTLPSHADCEHADHGVVLGVCNE